MHLLPHEAPRFPIKEQDDDGVWFIPRHFPEHPRGGEGLEECVYLGPEGCTVHDIRPLTCRMFDCRAHMVCGIGDPNNPDMVGQWDASAWNDTEAVILIGALRTAAKTYADKNPGTTSATPIIEYAFSHFPIWLGPVADHLEKDTKSFEDLQDSL